MNLFEIETPQGPCLFGRRFFPNNQVSPPSTKNSVDCSSLKISSFSKPLKPLTTKYT